LASVAAILAAPVPVSACGGFFCTAATPVNQAAERIIFADDGSGRVSAVVQILYDGPAESFSWLLPVPSLPEIGISSNVAFLRLQAASNPTFTIETRVEGDCIQEPVSSRGGEDLGSTNDPSDVYVEGAGTVGPYDYTVLSVAEGSDDAAADVLTWLVDNGYDVTDTGPELIRPYLERGDLLVAFRLTKGATVGEIRPVVLEYEAESPCIPIRLTAVAANADMGVMVWVLGSARAVPTNYRDLVLNEALIDWFAPGDGYDEVVTAAANEAGGQGFVTELAGSTDAFADTVLPGWEASDLNYWAATDWSNEPVELILASLSVFPGWDGVVETINESVPLLEDDTARDLLACLPDCDSGRRCVESALACLPDDFSELFDPTDYLDALSRNVVEPMAETQALIDRHEWITRFYTTLSAAEMTVDPVFDFNPDLAPLSNVHTATRIIECEPHLLRSEAPWRVVLPQGDSVRGQGALVWPFNLDSDMPVNRQVRQQSTTGQALVIDDNRFAISDFVAEYNAVATDDEDGCGCSATQTGAPHLVALLLAALVCRVSRRSKHG